MSKEQNVLIIGGGGREDALAWKLRQSPQVEKIFVAPGNAGTERFSDTYCLVINSKNPTEIVQAARDLKANLVVIGPEDPLILGVADHLRSCNISVFGPGKAGANLEGSKAMAVSFMAKYGIPRPMSEVFDKYSLARDFLKNVPSCVIKTDGPAGGKGVFVCQTREEVEEALEQIMRKKIFGQSGKKVVIQEKLQGFEVSVMALVSGKDYVLLPYSEDHKQAYDDDLGPNTGGMGVATPHSLITLKLAKEIEEKIVKPTIKGLKQEGIDFQGVLYPGVMVTSSGPKVLEYNVRFGDPETEAVLPIITGDFFSLLKDTASGTLRRSTFLHPVKNVSAVTVTLAGEGYPNSYQKGTEIFGLASPTTETEVVVFHAGTELNKDGKAQTSGGRVLMVTGLGATIEEARDKAYGAIGPNGIHFDGMQYRRDIGARKRI